MGLKLMYGLVYVILPIALVGCMAKKDVIENKPRKYYFECCDPGINAAQKDTCKWLVEQKAHAFKDKDGNIYQAVWSDCKEGEEPWRKWE